MYYRSPSHPTRPSSCALVLPACIAGNAQLNLALGIGGSGSGSDNGTLLHSLSPNGCRARRTVPEVEP